jgi:hypothetical protein
VVVRWSTQVIEGILRGLRSFVVHDRLFQHKVRQMPSTVRLLTEAADASYGGHVFWGKPVPQSEPGIYMIALTDDVDGEVTMEEPPIDPNRVQLLLDRRPELRVDGSRPSSVELMKRITSMWLPDESVIYIGKATNTATRVSQYYATSLGARSPHAGGWPLKVLSNLDELTVHWATTDMPELAEQKALAAFVQSVSSTCRSDLWDPQHPYPFANLEGPGGRKRHGIQGARESRARQLERPRETQDSATTASPAPAAEAGGMRHSGGRVTLHGEIAAVLGNHGNRWMTTQEIATLVAIRGVYKKRDGTSDVTAFQVHGRTKNYPHLFERDGIRVRLVKR